jgi:flagellar basal-body rod modification protein FlgD
MPEAVNTQRQVSTRQSAEELARTKNAAEQVNKGLKAKGKSYGESMGKDSFLKLLVTELRHQDPTQPMADKEFIAQMAQFSSLEQMQSINTSITSLNNKARTSEAYELIGKRVQAYNEETGKKIDGVVSHVLRQGGDVRLVVGGDQVSLDEVIAVSAYEPKQPAVQQQPASQTHIEPQQRGKAAESYNAAAAPAQPQTIDKTK